jgi:ribonuclease D
VQVATREQIYCADPLSDTDLSHFWRELMSHAWILHSGRQDIEVIYHSSGAMPGEVFDTQIAAALLGHPAQIGYANLVSALFQVKLAKSHTRADWSKRPLPRAAIEYAAEDVAYLLPAMELLSEQLDQRGQLEWARQDSADLLEEKLYALDLNLAVQRLKGAKNLTGYARAAAARLARWREKEAIERDRPRQWIMRDNVLLEIAMSRPKSKKELLTIAGLSERTAARAGERILAELRAAIDDTDDYRPPPRPNEQQKSVLKKAQTSVAAVSEGLGISAEIVAPKKELAKAMQGRRDLRIFRGWREDLVGAELRMMFDEV